MLSHAEPAADVSAVSIWRSTSRLDKVGSKEGQPTFNCLLLQFGVVAQGVQDLADLMHEVENQPVSTILQVSQRYLQRAQTVLTSCLTTDMAYGSYTAIMSSVVD